ncbi:MAG: hypothetical protein Q4C70_15795, partial [Planctomycetia bacterium]|nr:hypothetical protein [Planctomycetia bacterium]
MNQYNSYFCSNYRFPTNRVTTGLFLGLISLLDMFSTTVILPTVAHAEEEQILYTSQAPLQEQNPDAEPIPPAPVPLAERTQKYIVLQNGSILFGDLKLYGDQYEITTETGTLVFPQTKVTQIADNLHQIYTYRSAQVFVNDLEARCEMLRWCLQYELIDESDEQLTLLKQYAPEHALVEVFERRLNFLKNKKQREREEKQRQLARTGNTSGNTSENMESQVAQIHVTYAELEHFSETVSQDAFDVFRKKVQPILQKNCMTAECHGPNSITGYRLLRVSPRMGRGEILQNLYATVQHLNTQQPEKSPFLRKPVTPHGHDSRTIFVNQDYATYQILIAWTYLITQNRYVIPREFLLPPPSSIPVYTPPQRGLVRISSATPAPEGPWNMSGVDVSLYPQMLYPEDYAVKNPYASVQKNRPENGNTGNSTGNLNAGNATRNLTGPRPGKMPPLKLVLPTEKDETEMTPIIPGENPMPEESVAPEVMPASGEMPREAEPNQVVPVSGEENMPKSRAPRELERTEIPVKPVKPKSKTGTDWEAVRRSINEALGETPETETETE